MFKAFAVLSSIGLCVVSVGCGGGAMDDSPENELSFESIDEALSTNEQCHSVFAHRTTTGDPGSFTTNNTYDPAGCHDAYLIDATDFVGYTELQFNPSFKQVSSFTHNTTPTTESACEKQRLGVYIWRKNSDGSTTYLGHEWSWSIWNESASQCVVSRLTPSFMFDIGRTQTTRDYRFAASARSYAVAGDTNSAYTRNAIKVLTHSVFQP